MTNGKNPWGTWLIITEIWHLSRLDIQVHITIARVDCLQFLGILGNRRQIDIFVDLKLFRRDQGQKKRSLYCAASLVLAAGLLLPAGEAQWVLLLLWKASTWVAFFQAPAVGVSPCSYDERILTPAQSSCSDEITRFTDSLFPFLGQQACFKSAIECNT